MLLKTRLGRYGRVCWNQIAGGFTSATMFADKTPTGLMAGT
jgi:hypothetical protein